MQTFEELSDIFSDHNNYLTSRELLMRVSVVCCICFKCNLTMLPVNAFKKHVCNWKPFTPRLQTFFFFFFSNAGRHFKVCQFGELCQGAPETHTQETTVAEGNGKTKEISVRHLKNILSHCSLTKPLE